jgi:hypothetical protein
MESNIRRSLQALYLWLGSTSAGKQNPGKKDGRLIQKLGPQHPNQGANSRFVIDRNLKQARRK